MISFICGTTPKFILTSPINLNQLGNIKIRLSQLDTMVDYTPIVNAEGKTASFKITQNDSLKFSPGIIKVQLCAVSGSGDNETVCKSLIAAIECKDTIIKEEIHNGKS